MDWTNAGWWSLAVAVAAVVGALVAARLAAPQRAAVSRDLGRLDALAEWVKANVANERAAAVADGLDRLLDAGGKRIDAAAYGEGYDEVARLLPKPEVPAEH